MRAVAERRLWRLLVILVVAGIAAVSGCGFVSQPTMLQQLQDPTPLPPIAVSDEVVIKIAGKLSEQWSRRNDISELFTYGAEVSLAALTTAVIAAPQAAVGLGIGQAIWMAFLRIFRPAEHGLIYMEGNEALNDSLTAFILCSANAGRVTVSSKQFTPCGAELFIKVGAAANSVARGRWQLWPRRIDLEKIQPLPIENQPKSLVLPKSAVGVP